MSSSNGDSTLDRIIAERREKATKLRDLGRNPYRNDFKPTHHLGQIRARYGDTKPEEPAPGIHPIDGETVRLAGRVIARRGFGKTVFAPIRDRGGDLQLFLNVEHVDESDWSEALAHLDVGDIVGAEGVVFWTKRGELSLLVKRFEIISKSLRPLPDKHGGLKDVELRYRQRYLDLAVNAEIREVFRKRAQIVTGIRRFLDARDFLEVETPMMHAVIGGAAARPFVTHHNSLDMRLYMRIAPELHLKRLVVGGLERVYEINRCFRNEGLSRQHNPEFTTLEFYWAYATYEDLMALTEKLVSELANDINGHTKASWDGVEVDLAPGWQRITVIDATTELGGAPRDLWDDPKKAATVALERGVRPGEVARILVEGQADPSVQAPDKLTGADVDRLCASVADPRVTAGHLGFTVFEATAEDKLVEPTFLTQFPLATSPLSRKNDADPAFVDRFELFVNGAEIANGFSELNDPDDQRARFEAQIRARQTGADETMDYDEDYCRALELGMPSAAGEGIGIDRLAMLLTGQPSIRDVILFPLMRSEEGE